LYFLGLSSYAHDSAVALLEDGRVLAVIEEERLNRQKHTGEFPAHAIRRALADNGLDLSDIDEVGFFVKPLHLMIRRGLRALRYLPASIEEFTRKSPTTALRVLTLERHLRNDSIESRRPPRFRFSYIDHHLAHAASAFHLSPFEEAAILCIDGAGEDITTWFGHGQGTRTVRRHCVRLPHSLGLFYSAVTHWLGFKPWGGEGKVMGLASYGDPDRFYREMRELVHWTEDGQLTLDLRYFSYHLSGWERWVSPAFLGRFGPAREPESEMTRHYEDVAAALQRVVEDAALALVRHLHRIVPSRNLCLAGGVALNSVMNGRIALEGPFERIFIQPAANDAGTALGSALVLAHGRHGKPRVPDNELVYLGPAFSDAACEAAARSAQLRVERPADLMETVSELLAAGRIVGWFQGRMEVGPRALGNRSILADPRDPRMKDTLNRRVKHREPFRPFAPSVLAGSAADWFEGARDSPHMLLVYPVVPGRREQVPAITHVDGTARVQTVTREANARYYDLISAFGRRTGVPMLLNTSFNVRSEPIVCTPDDAVRCFLGTEMDVLVLGDLVCQKPEDRSRGDGR
jgi:carbamoyltransferase